MTRSPRADHGGERRREVARWLSLVTLVAACSGRELSLGGDPALFSVGSSGSAGSFTTGAGGSGAGGGVVGSGGSGGSFITGGAGGAVPPSGTGGSFDLGGSSGVAEGGAGDDPYPLVTWQDGQGYRGVCPEHDGTSGFTCWHESSGTGTTCAIDGSPFCNACSCAIPCERASDCPSGRLGEPAGCFGSSTNVSSCFLTCDAGPCPLGMACSTYPGTNDRVCLWVTPDPGMLPPVK